MDMLVLKQEDQVFLLSNLLDKLQEETDEACEAFILETNERVAEETLDVVQICIGILDVLEKKGVNIKELFEKHNKKLLTGGDPLKPQRPWEYEAVIHITKEGGQSAEGEQPTL